MGSFWVHIGKKAYDTVVPCAVRGYGDTESLRIGSVYSRQWYLEAWQERARPFLCHAFHKLDAAVPLTRVLRH